MIAHRELAEGMAGSAVVLADHIASMHHHSVVVVEVAEYRAFGRILGGRTDLQQAEAHMAQLACHQEQRQLDRHFG